MMRGFETKSIVNLHWDGEALPTGNHKIGGQHNERNQTDRKNICSKGLYL